MLCPLGDVGRIVGIVYNCRNSSHVQGFLKAYVRFSPTKYRANLDAYYEQLTISVAPTQMNVGMIQAVAPD